MSERFISVVVPTCKRLADLEECLASLAAQDYSKESYEIIVVDQGTERIDELIAKYSSERHVRFISQDILSLSVARNTGIAQARGDYIAFIDDDAVASRNWLSSLMSCYQDDEIGIVGGRILPLWADGASSLYKRSDYARSLFSLFDLGDSNRVVSRVLGNFSARKKLFNEFGGFDTRIGRKGAVLLGGEETEFCERVGERYRVLYCADAVFHHKIHKERLSLSWLAKRSYYGGLTKGLQGRRPKPVGRMRLTWFDYALLVSYFAGLLMGMLYRVVLRR